ncbi:hypothetical protein TW95_gp1511 [Pandoravirus inopinatum]|uniref:Uncharacterized protein n=1 Tax=Pandoravirus inopinatum TaxID=1605721 RepID=A0A0B5J8K0_9VIRU|nr:hypothetical protein TW95_gp1511 [Pandoravirus inopinatum]AJF98245.1 hypothetical protein [Pandoravirus inopinatum]
MRTRRNTEEKKGNATADTQGPAGKKKSTRKRIKCKKKVDQSHLQSSWSGAVGAVDLAKGGFVGSCKSRRPCPLFARATTAPKNGVDRPRPKKTTANKSLLVGGKKSPANAAHAKDEQTRRGSKVSKRK